MRFSSIPGMFPFRDSRIVDLNGVSFTRENHPTILYSIYLRRNYNSILAVPCMITSIENHRNTHQKWSVLVKEVSRNLRKLTGWNGLRVSRYRRIHKLLVRLRLGNVVEDRSSKLSKTCVRDLRSRRHLHTTLHGLRTHMLVVMRDEVLSMPMHIHLPTLSLH